MSRRPLLPLLVLALAAGSPRLRSGQGRGAERPDPAAARAVLEKFLTAQGPTERGIKALVARLGHEEFAVRERATQELIALGDAARPFVEDATKSDDPEVRLRAQAILQAPRQPAADAGPDLGQAIEVLAAAKDKALLPLLLKLLDSPRVDVRYAAEYGLRRVAGQEFGYNAHADEQARAAAAAQARQWWAAAEATFAFDAKPAAAPMPAGVLLSSRRLGKVWMVSLEGKTLWAKEFEGELSRAKALPNGHVLLAHKTRAVVEEYDADWKVVWAAGEGKLAGDVLDLDRLPNGNTLVAHTGGNRIVEFDPAGKEAWSVPVERMPIAAERLPNGNTLVTVLYGREWDRDAEAAQGRVVEVTRSGQVAWSKPGLAMPTDVQPLPSGTLLVTEQGLNRVIELDRDGQVVWERKCEGMPNSARRLPDGTTVLNDTTQGILLVDKEGKLVRKLDETERAGKLSLIPAGTLLPKKQE
jgi:hypothetical protein